MSEKTYGGHTVAALKEFVAHTFDPVHGGDTIDEVCNDNGTSARVITDLIAEVARLNVIIHAPESDDFLKGVVIEAEYQRQLHGVDASDARFEWHQWYWVVGYLLGKALAACKSGEGNGEKAKHHLVTSAALINNWHNVLIGKPAASVHSNSGKPVADLLAAQPSSGENHV